MESDTSLDFLMFVALVVLLLTVMGKPALVNPK